VEQIAPNYSNYKENYTETSTKFWNQKNSSMPSTTTTETHWHYKTESQINRQAWKHSDSNLDFENVDWIFLLPTFFYGNKENAVKAFKTITGLVNEKEVGGNACYALADSNDGKQVIVWECYKDTEAIANHMENVGELIGELFEAGDLVLDGGLMVFGSEENVQKIGQMGIKFPLECFEMDVMVARKGWYF